MAFTLSPTPQLQFLDGNGVPLAGGLLYSWAAGQIGTLPQATYSDSIGTQNTNPVVLDAAGRAVVYLGPVSYGFQLRTALGVLVWTQDHVDPTVSPASGNLSLAGALTVAGNTTLGGNLAVALSTTLSGNLAVALNATIAGNFSVAGLLGGAAFTAVAYTPIWSASSSAPGLGNGTLTGSYLQMGSLVIFRIYLQMGSTTTFGGGIYTFSLPVARTLHSGTNFALGATSIAEDASAGEFYMGTALDYDGGTGTDFRLYSVTSPTVAYLPTSPFTFAANDSISIAGVYLAP